MGGAAEFGLVLLDERAVDVGKHLREFFKKDAEDFTHEAGVAAGAFEGFLPIDAPVFVVLLFVTSTIVLARPIAAVGAILPASNSLGNGDEFVDDRIEFVGADRLGDVAIHARFFAAIAVAFHGMGRHGDDGDVDTRGFLSLADGASCFEAIEDRHLNVHQDDVELVFGRSVDGELTVADDRDIVPAFFEEKRGEFLVDGVVFGQEHSQTPVREERKVVDGGLFSLDGGGLSAEGRGALGERFEEVGVFDGRGDAEDAVGFVVEMVLGGCACGVEEDKLGVLITDLGFELFDERTAVAIDLGVVDENDGVDGFTDCLSRSEVYGAILNGDFGAPAAEELGEELAALRGGLNEEQGALFELVWKGRKEWNGGVAIEAER